MIVADYFCDPEHKLNPHAVLMGATMMASTLSTASPSPPTTSQHGYALPGSIDLRLLEPIGFQQCIVGSKPTH